MFPYWSAVASAVAVMKNGSAFVQEVSIDITERDPKSYPGGIPYKLIAEACIPSINIDDIGSIFEEHRVCKNLSVWQHSMDVSQWPWFGLIWWRPLQSWVASGAFRGGS